MYLGEVRILGSVWNLLENENCLNILLDQECQLEYEFDNQGEILLYKC